MTTIDSGRSASADFPRPSTPAGGARRYARPALMLMVIAGAQLMVVLDATIVNIALPSMGDYFHRDQTDMTWALNAYTLAFGGLLLLGGRSGDILGRRRMFIVGLGLFSVGSLLGGLATSFQFLLLGRIVQGIGGAIASPTALSLITTSFPEGKERNRAVGVYAAVSGAGAALGLLLGGILTDLLSWRWVLFVNVPIGAVLIVGAFLYLQDSERLRGSFDIVGALLSVPGMALLVYAFIHAANDGWSNTTTVLSFAVSIVLLVAFVVAEAKLIRDPMMPMRIFSYRSRAGAYVVMLIVGAGMFGMFYFVTYFIQGVMHFSPLKTGFAFLPVALMIGVSAQFVAQLLPRFGPKPLILTGTVLLTLSMFNFARVNPHVGYWTFFLPTMLVMAIGMGCIFVPITTVAVSKVKDTDAGLASALLNVGQQVGGSIGLSVLATVAATAARNSTNTEVGKLVASGQIGPAQAPKVGLHIGQLAGGNLTPEALRDPIAAQVAPIVQAHSSGMGFLAAAIFGCVSIVVAALVINVKKDEVPTTPAPEVVAA